METLTWSYYLKTVGFGYLIPGILAARIVDAPTITATGWLEMTVVS
jgi:hypothetical protein